MNRFLRLLPILTLILCVSAFGQILDPNVGVFDPSASCAPTCGLHPNPIGLSEFGVYNFGNAGDDALPWYIIFAVPNNKDGAPTLSSDSSSPDSFTASGPTDAGAWASSSSQTLYEFVGPSTTLTAAEINGANNSMNTTNMFGADESAAFGSIPSSFEVYVYSMSGALPHQVAELFDTDIVAGTYVAVLGASTSTNKQGKTEDHVYASPYTTAGLGGGSNGGGGDTGGGGGTVPEPGSIILLGSALLGITAGLRRKLVRS